jgi:hypothetical protein
MAAHTLRFTLNDGAGLASGESIEEGHEGYIILREVESDIRHMIEANKELTDESCHLLPKKDALDSA